MSTVLFDFFGTLVSYSPSRIAQGYRHSSAILRQAGCRLGYDEWLALWATTSEELDLRARSTGIEYSMLDAFAHFAERAGLDGQDLALAEAFITQYLLEWNTAVSLVAGVPEMLRRLQGARHRLVLVTNTHDAAMIRGHLDAMGIADGWAAVVTSIEVGFRKPRPEIFAAALAAVSPTTVDDCVFVGDSFGPDYLGPTRFGIDAYLIVPEGDPHPADLPADRRLRSVLDIETRL